MPIIKRHQTLLDFATQKQGSAEGLVQMALNNELSVTDDVAGGTVLQTSDAIDTNTAAQLANIDIATKDNAPQNEGIGYWGLGTTFKID